MADWRTIADTEVDPDAPVTSELAYAFRDNVIAAFEGATGGPKLQDLALDDVAVNATARGGRWVTRRNAFAVAQAAGTYIFARWNPVGGAGTAVPGTVVSGSLLNPASANNASNATLAGSWMCMGFAQAGTAETTSAYTLWLRVT